MPIKNQETKDFWTNTVPSYSFIILWIIFLVVSFIQSGSITRNNNTNPITWTVINNTWFNIEILSWNINESTWAVEVVKIPDDERWYLDYILKNWVAWTDYISVEPPKPTVIHWSKEDNNKIMYQYFYKNKITFDIPKTEKTPYIMIVTKKEIASNRDFFLWIDWKSLWAIRKDKSLPVYDYNEYLYPLYSITKAWYNWQIFDVKSHVNNWKLRLNIFVWESWNYVEKIILFFK